LRDCDVERPAVHVRAEQPDDAPGIRAVHCAAFGRAAEADLIARLRENGLARVSLVAVQRSHANNRDIERQAIIGHVVCSPGTIVNDGRPRDVCALLTLGPVAVLPASQGRGVGAMLIREAIAACRSQGGDVLVVLGHTAYYPRFGFVPAKQFNLDNEYGADDAFMAMRLREQVRPTGGLVQYAAPFRDLADKIGVAAACTRSLMEVHRGGSDQTCDR